MTTIEEVKKHLIDAGFEQRSKSVFRMGKIEIVASYMIGTFSIFPFVKIKIWNNDMSKDLEFFANLDSVEIYDVSAE